MLTAGVVQSWPAAQMAEIAGMLPQILVVAVLERGLLREELIRGRWLDAAVLRLIIQTLLLWRLARDPAIREERRLRF